MREAGAGAPAQGRVINLPVRLTWPDCLMWFGGAATVPPTPSYTLLQRFAAFGPAPLLLRLRLLPALP